MPYSKNTLSDYCDKLEAARDYILQLRGDLYNTSNMEYYEAHVSPALDLLRQAVNDLDMRLGLLIRDGFKNQKEANEAWAKVDKSQINWPDMRP